MIFWLISPTVMIAMISITIKSYSTKGFGINIVLLTYHSITIIPTYHPALQLKVSIALMKKGNINKGKSLSLKEPHIAVLWSHWCSLVPQTLWSQGAYRLEIISARSKRVWCNAYTFFVQRIAKSRDC